MINFQGIIVLLMAIVPAIIWLYLFLRKQHESKWLVILTFVGGMVAARLLIGYQEVWNETANLIFFKVQAVDFTRNIQSMIQHLGLALFVTFLGVGVIEEVAKFWIMKLIDHNHFNSIDDVIELAVVSALGFAFFENVIYFFNHIKELSAGGFFFFALFRVTIVTMVHVLCSGVLGYYYGMAFFASPMLKIQQMKKKTHPVIAFLKKALHLRRSQVYHDEMFLIGLVIAVVLHGLYDFLLDPRIAEMIGFNIGFMLMPVYFFGGYWYLNKLMDKKDAHLKLGLVGTQVMPKQDFEKLLSEVQEIKAQMQQGAPVQEVKPLEDVTQIKATNEQ